MNSQPDRSRSTQLLLVANCRFDFGRKIFRNFVHFVRRSCMIPNFPHDLIFGFTAHFPIAGNAGISTRISLRHECFLLLLPFPITDVVPKLMLASVERHRRRLAEQPFQASGASTIHESCVCCGSHLWLINRTVWLTKVPVSRGEPHARSYSIRDYGDAVRRRLHRRVRPRAGAFSSSASARSKRDSPKLESAVRLPFQYQNEIVCEWAWLAVRWDEISSRYAVK